MSFQKIRKYINDAVLAIFVLIDVLLLFRFMLKLIAARTESSFVAGVYGTTDGFVSLFDGTLGSIPAGPLLLEIDTLIAIFVYFAVGFGLFKILEAAFERVAQDKIRLAVDTLFKVGEVALGMRLFFKLVGAGDSRFVSILYSLSDVFYKPFEGLLPSVGADKFVFETATLIAIIILVILDVVSEKLFQESTKRSKDSTEPPKEFVKPQPQAVSQPVQPVQEPQVIQPAVSTPVAQPTPLPQPAVQSVKGAIANILVDKTGQSAIMEVDNLLSPLFYKNPNLLTRSEKNIVLIEDLEREINNGGFKQFFQNSSGGFANETLAALTAIGSQNFSKLLREAIDVFPNSVVPKVNDLRRNTILSIELTATPIWSKLDTEFYKYDEDIYHLLITYIQENIGDFR